MFNLDQATASTVRPIDTKICMGSLFKEILLGDFKMVAFNSIDILEQPVQINLSKGLPNFCCLFLGLGGIR